MAFYIRELVLNLQVEESAELALLCIAGRQTYGGMLPRAPSLWAMTEPRDGCWLFGFKPVLNPAVG